MRAVTIRRLIVLGVCALGVGGLYLVPGLARSPVQVAGPVNDLPTAGPTTRWRHDAPQGNSAPTATVTAMATVTTVTETEAALPDPEPESESRQGPPPDPATDDAPPRSEASANRTGRAPGGATVEPGRTLDEIPPRAVRKVEMTEATADELTLAWSGATDNVRLLGYRVWLDGFLVRTTSATVATIAWFNDDADQHVVQVRALDTAGNQSALPATVLVRRPAPSASPSPSVPSTPTPGPTASPEPTDLATPSPSPSGADGPN